MRSYKNLIRALMLATVAAACSKSDDAETTTPASEEATVLDMTGSLKLTKDAVESSVSAASLADSGLRLAGAESTWTTSGYGLGGDAGETPQEVVANYFNLTDDAQYFSVKRRVIDAIDLICVITYNLEIVDDLPAVGESEIVLDTSTQEEIIEACGISASFFDNISDGMTINATTEDVSAVEGSIYDRKILLESDFFTNNIYYRGNSVDGIRFLLNEPSSSDSDDPEAYKSTTVLSYDPDSGVLALDYISSFDNDVVPAKEVLRFYSDGTDVHLSGMLASGFDSGEGSNPSYYVVNASYKASSPSTLAISISSDKANTTSEDLSDSNACVSVADYSIATDDSLDCEVEGASSSETLTFFKEEMSQLEFAWHDDHGATRAVPFTNAEEMFSVVPE